MQLYWSRSSPSEANHVFGSFSLGPADTAHAQRLSLTVGFEVGLIRTEGLTYAGPIDYSFQKSKLKTQSQCFSSLELLSILSRVAFVSFTQLHSIWTDMEMVSQILIKVWLSWPRPPPRSWVTQPSSTCFHHVLELRVGLAWSYERTAETHFKEHTCAPVLPRRDWSTLIVKRLQLDGNMNITSHVLSVVELEQRERERNT